MTPGAAASIAFEVQPSAAVAGVALAPAVVVRLRDAEGNPIGGSPQVTMTLEGPGDPELLGTTTVTASNGVATFSALRIEQAGQQLADAPESGDDHMALQAAGRRGGALVGARRAVPIDPVAEPAAEPGEQGRDEQ